MANKHGNLKDLFTAIANVIRRKTGSTEIIIADDFPLVIEEAFENVEEQGFASGKFEGIEEGKQAEYDRFWDAFQQNGNRNNYTYGFCRWDRTTFLPKYDIRGTFNTTFHSFNSNDPNWETFDMAQHLEDLGVVLDTSASDNMLSLFMWARIGRIGVIDCTGIAPRKGLQTAFGYGKIRTIDKLIVTPNVLFTDTFINNSELTNITFEGIIGNAISFQWQNKLSDASVQSVIDHLQDLTGADSKTVTFHGTVGEKLTEEQKAVITAKNWTLVY